MYKKYLSKKSRLNESILTRKRYLKEDIHHTLASIRHFANKAENYLNMIIDYCEENIKDARTTLKRPEDYNLDEDLNRIMHVCNILEKVVKSEGLNESKNINESEVKITNRSKFNTDAILNAWGFDYKKEGVTMITINKLSGRMVEIFAKFKDGSSSTSVVNL